MDKLISTVKAGLTKGKGLKLLVIIGIVGIGLILISEFLPKKTATPSATSSAVSAGAVSDYKQEMQQRLSEILAAIEGVGKVDVMLTVSASEEVVFAQEVKEDESLEASKRTTARENSYVLVDGTASGKKEALVRKVLTPQISGVVIVCEGGANSVVKESIYKAVSVALEIPTNKIYVAKSATERLRK